MSTKSMNITLRVNPEIKAQADPVLARIGITATQLFNLLLSQVAITKSVPFPLISEPPIVTFDPITQEYIPSPSLEQYLQDVEDGKEEFETFDNLDDLFAGWEAE